MSTVRYGMTPNKKYYEKRTLEDSYHTSSVWEFKGYIEGVQDAYAYSDEDYIGE